MFNKWWLLLFELLKESVSFRVTNCYNIVYGNILDTIAGVLTCFLYIPQIRHTYSIKTSGNFSVLMLSIQMPGAFAIFVYQSFMSNTSVTAGLPYLISGIQQLFLLILCIYYDYFYNKNRYIKLDEENGLIIN